ncbi:hypothetical protein F4820DRAFT_135795 [Hypoxylon rubiginosum]|uniref:Uncharacterized protein n=1 Tax=Hypoxylon rubiginosum TaxID=110542 RepID=A0ACB9ZBB3_9PEZI|nr:hypothetical protein F4820DRAFT_135795 [Hypoxylon rubiginosum]
MPAPTNKTNFKTYEASTRLLAAVIATNHGKIKLDFKEIHKLFGESTAGGLAWQFRDIRAMGREMQDAVDKGENPADVKAPGFGTPSRVKPPKAARSGDTGGPAKRKRGGGGAGGAIAKKRSKVAMSDEEDDDDVDLDSTDFDAKDVHSDEKGDSGIGAGEDDDSDVQITPTPTPASKRTKLPEKPRSRLAGGSAASAKPAAKKNSSSKGSKGSKSSKGSNANNANNANNASSGAAMANSSVRRSLFGNGAKPAVPAGDDDDDGDVEVVDLSGVDAPARKMATRASRLKADPEPQQELSPEEQEEIFFNPFMGSNGMYGDEGEYMDGEA